MNRAEAQELVRCEESVAGFAGKVEKLRRAVRFEAWRDNRPVEDCPELDNCDTLDEAAALLAGCSPKGAVLTVLMADAGRGEKIVAFYKVQVSTKRGRWRAAYDGGRDVWEGSRVAKLIHSLPVHLFKPVEPFRVTRDTTVAQIVGVDPTVVEG